MAASVQTSNAQTVTDGGLPPGWRMVKFGDVVQQVKVRVDPEDSGLQRYVAGEHMDTDDLHIRRWGTIGDGYLGPAFHMKFVRGQVLYGSRRTYLRKVALAEFDGICANTTFVFEPKGDMLIPELLPFVLQTDSFHEHSTKQSRGSVNPYINFRDIAWYQFPLPPREEQRRIAEILWAADEAAERVSDLSMELERSLRLVTRSFLSKFSNQVVPIGEIAEVTNGTTPRRSRLDYWERGSIPWLPTGKVHDHIIESANEYVTDLAKDECSLRILPVGTILVAMIGEGKTRGSAALMNINAAINQNFAGIVPFDGEDNLYLFYVLLSSYETLRRMSHGSSQGALNCNLIKRFKIPLVPKREQLRMTRALEHIDGEIAATASHSRQIHSLKRSLTNHLLSFSESVIKPHVQ